VEKAGTTSLFAYLARHPEICASSVKEINHFFPRTGPLPPLAEYAGHYAHCDGEPYRLEASPSYWYGGAPVIEAIRQTLGRPRVVISLREPAARFWSAFTFLKSMSRLDKRLTADEYLSQCIEVEREQAGRPERTRHTPLSIGLYAEYLPPWIEAFGEDLRVMYAEDLFVTPEGTVAELCAWLALAPPAASSLAYETRNETITPRSYALARAADLGKRRLKQRLGRAPGLRRVLRETYRAVNRGSSQEVLADETRARLRDFYRESNRRLGDELTRAGYARLPHWVCEAAES
jgi:hypothetical protein